ncbi:MAG: hypothetical protein K2W96_05410 [Gemmataceae bacterium]|nr:hypothetical protein [Gemmataceae bacterium]
MARILTAVIAALALASSAQAQVMVYPSTGFGTMPAMRSMPTVVVPGTVVGTPRVVYGPAMGYRTPGFVTPTYGMYGTYRPTVGVYGTTGYPRGFRTARTYRTPNGGYAAAPAVTRRGVFRR